MPETIAIPSTGRIDVIRVEDILYLRSENNYTHIYLVSGERLVASKTLGSFEDFLKGGAFLRVHNQYLVNRVHITAYTYKTSQMVLIDQTRIPVARNKKAAFLDYLKSLMIQTL